VVIQPLSTRLIKPNFCFDLPHRRSTTVSLETRNPLCNISTYHAKLFKRHDFDEKSDFLNYEFSKKLLAITQFKNGGVQKRELGRGGCDIIRSRRHNKCGYFSMQKRSAKEECAEEEWKKLCCLVVVLPGLADVTRRYS